MSRWIAYLRANEGTLLGGMLASESSAFETEGSARDWLETALKLNESKCRAEGFVYGPGVRVEISPACDEWMMGARFGEIVSISPRGLIQVRLDKLPRRSFKVHARYLQGVAK